jgi:serine/threonine protein kinase
LDTTSMEQEVSLLQSLDHPYIVQLVDVFLHHGVAMYLVMELVAGGDLFDRIVDQHRYTEVDARRAMRRLLSAVYYLHEIKNIVHRDLKPENILCASPTHVKLADFGLAKIMKADGLKTFCGTPQYFAPEVLQRRHTVSGEGRYGKPADMWSLGVILYILLTGKPPFSADLDQPQPYACEFDDDALWQNMPMAQELVQQLLRMDPKRRLSVRQACDHPWINTADGDTHSHPLDDPVVTARKRLFSETEIAVNDEAVNEEEEDADDAATSQDETNSIVSKESVLSKEVFAAAATSHQRDNSFFHVEETSDTLFQKAVQPKEEDEPMDTKEEDAVETHMSIDNVPEKDTEQPDSYKEQEIPSTGEKTEPIINRPETATDPTSASPEVAITAELSVTPSECDDCSPPRSPLSSMNLNERSNQFRDHVLGGQNNSQDKSPSPEARRPENNQVAVTPTDSNITGTAKSTSEKSQEADVLEDPILSQFSSAPCSLESFPDSPQKAASPSNDKKRPMLEEEAGELQQPEAKRGRTVRQTTLSAWFVKKKADD